MLYTWENQILKIKWQTRKPTKELLSKSKEEQEKIISQEPEKKGASTERKRALA